MYQAFFSISNGKLLVQKFKTQTEIVSPFHFIIEDIVHGYEVPVPIRGSPISPIENPHKLPFKDKLFSDFKEIKIDVFFGWF